MLSASLNSLTREVRKLIERLSLKKKQGDGTAESSRIGVSEVTLLPRGFSRCGPSPAASRGAGLSQPGLPSLLLPPLSDPVGAALPDAGLGDWGSAVSQTQSQRVRVRVRLLLPLWSPGLYFWRLSPPRAALGGDGVPGMARHVPPRFARPEFRMGGARNIISHGSWI